MQYLGSKSKIAKELLPIILKEHKGLFVDVMTGGANLIDKVTGPRLANDNNEYLIAMWKALQNGWKPPEELTREKYYEIKANPSQYPMELVCFAAFLCSFGGKWWGGFAFNNKGDNYAARAKRVLLKQIVNLKDVEFTCKDYFDLEIRLESTVYCDIPYKGTTQYKDKFDYDRFWNWARNVSRTNHVFISEYSAPDDFKCVKEIPHKTILDKNSQYPRIERLFVHENRI